MERLVKCACQWHGSSGGSSPSHAGLFVAPSEPHGVYLLPRIHSFLSCAGRSWLFESGPYKGDQAIHGAFHHVHWAIQRSLIRIHSAIQQEVQRSLNCYHRGSNELPCDRVFQGAAHQAPQGSVISTVTFELPSEAFELPCHTVNHGETHGVIHMHNAIH